MILLFKKYIFAQNNDITFVMERKIYNQLKEWKNASTRKPLMLYGARQVGKTYILKEFGRNEYRNMVYLNCYMNEPLKQLFSTDADVNRILLGLSAISNEEILPGSTLVFLDEVQEIPEVVASLKYFCEDAPEINIVVAGSLLGVMNMHDVSFPTGKVDIMHMYPMTYMEFLEANGEKGKVDLLKNPKNATLVNSILPSLIELLRQYYFVGGMPEAVSDFVKNKNPESVRKIQQNILTAYEADIAKHAGADTQKARLVFQSIPSQLAKENKKFIFGAIKKGARASLYENAIQWLVDAGLVYRVPRISRASIPLKFYEQKESFKLYLLDIGLLGAMVGIPAASILIGHQIFTEFKGAFTENYVLTQMEPLHDIIITYYAKENSSLEIDFVIQLGDKIIPIEVKAEENVKSKSLRQFVTIDNAEKKFYGVRFSMKGYENQDWMINVPLFAVEPFLESQYQKLIGGETESNA